MIPLIQWGIFLAACHYLDEYIKKQRDLDAKSAAYAETRARLETQLASRQQKAQMDANYQYLITQFNDAVRLKKESGALFHEYQEMAAFMVHGMELIKQDLSRCSAQLAKQTISKAEKEKLFKARGELFQAFNQQKEEFEKVKQVREYYRGQRDAWNSKIEQIASSIYWNCGYGGQVWYQKYQERKQAWGQRRSEYA
jgi:hypothetical protein